MRKLSHRLAATDINDGPTLKREIEDKRISRYITKTGSALLGIGAVATYEAQPAISKTLVALSIGSLVFSHLQRKANEARYMRLEHVAVHDYNESVEYGTQPAYWGASTIERIREGQVVSQSLPPLAEPWHQGQRSLVLLHAPEESVDLSAFDRHLFVVPDCEI